MDEMANIPEPTSVAAPAPAADAAQVSQPPSSPAPERLWTRQFVGMIFMRFFTSFALNAYVSIMALYAMERFAAGEGMAGVASGAFIIGAMVMRFFTAKYTEIIGRTRLMRGSAVAFFLTSLPYLLSPEFLGIWGLVAVRLAHGMSMGVLANTNAVAITEFVPHHRLGEGLGYFSLGTTMALAVGPLTAITLVQTVGYPAFFIVGAVMAALCAVTAFTVRLRGVVLAPEERDRLLHHTSIDQFIDFPTLPLALCMFVMCLCYAGVQAFLAPFTEELGQANLASIYFTVYALLLLLTRPMVGKLEDRRGENFVVYPTVLFAAIGFVVLSRLTGLLGILASALLMSCGYGCFFTALQALVMKRAEPVRMGVVTSTFFLFVDSGNGLGSAVLGSLVPPLGYRGMFLVCAGVMVALGILYYAVHGRKATREANAARDEGQRR